MNGTPAGFPRRVSTACGFSLVETTVSIALVGGLLALSLELVGATATGRKNMGDRSRAQLLARGLMSEIMTQSYEEPDDTPGFGREFGELGGSRLDYDDVDDYDNWVANPPEAKDGTKFVVFNEWQRKVTVEYVDPNDLTTVVGSDTGVKRITVTAHHNDKELAKMVAVRTSGM